jgi:16S rRNA (cytosine967-C5)-methyltransferase
MPTPARSLAFQFLLRPTRTGPHIADWLASGPPSALPERDGAFLRELLLGLLRRRGEMDKVLLALSSRPLGELEPAVLAGLRLGAYQLVHMRVPAHAAVGEAVDLVRTRSPRAAAFVNAVLRRLAREGPPPGPDPARSPGDWLEWQGSLPGWLAVRWLRCLGPERAIQRARTFLEIPPTFVRLNPRHEDAALRCDSEGLLLEPTFVPGAFRLTAGHPRLLLEAGILHIQDLASQAVAHIAHSSGRVLDSCAAPGGKTMLLADLAGADGCVVGAEVHPRRVLLLRRLLDRWGATDVWVVRADLEHAPFASSFDTVLVDAPCSGLGTLSRNPDIRWRVNEPDLSRHAERQLRLLDCASHLVRPGGRLVYSVCSLEPEETVDVIAAFTARNPRWSHQPLPPWIPARCGVGDALTIAPEMDSADGFFAVVLGPCRSDSL